jgi:hypothetical protein
MNYNKKKIAAKIAEAIAILQALGFPPEQQNVRSALTLLALLDLKPEAEWPEAASPLIGITPIMDFAKLNYRKKYAPNTRETFRRQTMHQFVSSGLAVENPDKPDRPTNSPYWVYQISPEALMLLKKINTSRWKDSLASYKVRQPGLAAKYAGNRKILKIPIFFDRNKVNLSPGNHSLLIKAIIEEFASRFAPGALPLYIGDTASKAAFCSMEKLIELGLEGDIHGKFPDVILYNVTKNWLFLIESVTSHGPMNSKRHLELKKLFKNTKSGLIFISAFPDEKTLVKYISSLSWETEVWMATSPDHLIHFDGERFLGPYDKRG